jgi:hypothetical protein
VGVAIAQIADDAFGVGPAVVPRLIRTYDLLVRVRSSQLARCLVAVCVERTGCIEPALRVVRTVVIAPRNCSVHEANDGGVGDEVSSNPVLIRQ